MTHKQIETSREMRLWLSQIVIPIMGVAMMVPEAREAVVAKTKKVTKAIKSKFEKK